MPKPEECRFAKTHEWIAPDGTVGISDHAQKEITDIVFIDLPKVGMIVKAAEACVVVESVKAAFDIYAPVSGRITETNLNVSKKPAIANQSPMDKGWLFKMEKTDPDEEKNLMAHADYIKFLDAETDG